MAVTSPVSAATTGSPAGYPAFSGRLYSVSASSASNVWAAGLTPDSSLIVHWDGSAWSRVPSPNPPAGYLNSLLGVAAICPHNAWAVGTTDNANTLITHWNGRAWS